MNEERSVGDIILASLPFMGVAMGGGFLRYVRYGFPSIKQTISSLMVAAFTGFICYTLAADYVESMNLLVCLVAMAGHGGGMFLDAMMGKMKKELGK